MKKNHASKFLSPDALRVFRTYSSKDRPNATPAEIAALAAQMTGAPAARAAKAVRLIWECAYAWSCSQEEVAKAGDPFAVALSPYPHAKLLKRLKTGLAWDGKKATREELYQRFLKAHPVWQGFDLQRNEGDWINRALAESLLHGFEEWRAKEVSNHNRRGGHERQKKNREKS